MKATVFLTLLVSCLYLNARDFKEGIIYDVRGSVKKVILHNNKPYFHYLDVATFATDGKIEGSITSFDNSGYPLGWSIDSNSLTTHSPYDSEDINHPTYRISYKVHYDDNHRIASTLMEYNVEGMEFEYANGVVTENRFFQYNIDQPERPEISEMKMLSRLGGSEYNTKCTYSNYVYDDHGNWTKRSVVETIFPTDDPQKIKTEEYVETRDILYY